MGRHQAVLSAGDPTAVAVHDITCRFGSHVAVDNVTLEARRGEFVSMLGPSGCGKTTLLRTIAGLERQSSGRVVIDGRDVSKEPPHRRAVGLVFQRYALFPHKSVGDNVAFPLMLARVPAAERKRRVDAMLDLVHLSGFSGRRVDELSGGQAQRVALARALVSDPPVLLLDEPLAALDLKLRQAMHIELREIQRRVGSTFVYVTHDQEEALVLSDRVVLMSHGKIVQQGPPREVYKKPATVFAAKFIGDANLFHGQGSTSGSDAVVDAGSVRFRVPRNGATVQGATSICLRPEQIRIRLADESSTLSDNSARGSVVESVFMGAVVRHVVDLNGERVLVETASEESSQPEPGAVVTLSWTPDAPVLLREDD